MTGVRVHVADRHPKEYPGAVRVETSSDKHHTWINVVSPDGIVASWQSHVVLGYEILPLPSTV